VLFIPKQLGLGLVVRPMKSFAFMQGFFDCILGLNLVMAQDNRNQMGFP
jgi:hypothetical protein